MTKVAIPHWQGRVSPVFDVAAKVLIVEFDENGEKNRQEVLFDTEGPFARAARLSDAAAEVLICGAISQPFYEAAASSGIEIIPQICGSVECVLAAFFDGRLRQDEFLMPGCCGRLRRRRRGGMNFLSRRNI